MPTAASLLEEMQYDDAKELLEKGNIKKKLRCFILINLQTELEELRQTKQEVEDNCSLLEAQLQQQQDRGDMEKRQLLSKHRQKQSELKKQIQSLEEQQRRLSITKEGVKNTCQTLSRLIQDSL